MTAEEAGIYLLHHLVNAPEFAVKQDDTLSSCLMGKASVGNEGLIDAVTEESGSIVVSAVAENDTVVFFDSLAVFSLNSPAREKIVIEFGAAVFLAGIDIEALLLKGS